MIKNVTIGADPEVFLHNGEEFISSEGLIGGTKYEPKYITEEGHAVQEDNVMAEFCIPPSKTSDDFCNNIIKVLDYLSDVAELNNSVISIQPSANFSDEQLCTPQAQTFGCDPDLSVYLEDFNPTISEIEGNIRFAGGHIHVGFDKPDFTDCIKLVKALDIFLGLPSVWLDKDTKRKKYYGTAGRFREKPYGIEYRTLSNFWLQNENKIKWAFNQVLEAVEFVNSGAFDRIKEEDIKSIQAAIDNNDFLKARLLYARITRKKVETI